MNIPKYTAESYIYRLKWEKKYQVWQGDKNKTRTAGNGYCFGNVDLFINFKK